MNGRGNTRPARTDTVATGPATTVALVPGAAGSQLDPSSQAAPRDFSCRSCGDAVGVYEPVAVVEGERARITSRAAEPELAPSGVYFHRECYERSRESVDSNLRRSAWRRAAGGAPPA
ncbi:MAG TPA: hypothetical protein VHU13_02605 [Solirubrobacteraceae bacterium]|jgi:hypothetical protein|nr:hypothetical protein [Solirubrobacteraceae bacterium]